MGGIFDKQLSKWSKKRKMGKRAECFYIKKVIFLTDTSAFMASFSKKIEKNDLESSVKFQKVQKNSLLYRGRFEKK